MKDLSNLTTRTFNQDRDRNNAALARLTADFTVDLSELKGAARSKGIKLLEQRIEIEDAASARAQLNYYSRAIGAWDHDWIRIAQIPVDRQINLKPEQLRNRVLAMISNTKLDRFNRCVVPSHRWAVPRCEIKPNGRVWFDRVAPTRRELDRLSIAGALPSPDLISDKLAIDIGMIRIDHGNIPNTAVRLMLKSSPQALAYFKKVYDCADPLNQGENRVLVIKRSNQNIERLYPGVPNLPEWLVGSILYSHGDASGHQMNGAPASDEGRLVMQFFQTAYSAHRRTLHVQARYEREVEQIAAFAAELKQFTIDLRIQWRAGVAEQVKEQLRNRSEELWERGERLFSRCENRFKVRVGELLQNARQLKDRTGRDNPMAAVSQFIAAVDGLEKRFSEMYGKDSYNAKDRAMLTRLIADHEQIFKSLRRNLQLGRDNLSKRHTLFGSEPLTEKAKHSHVQQIMGALGLHREFFEQQVVVRPFTTVATQVCRASSQMREALVNRDLDSARAAYTKLDLVMRCYIACVTVERIRRMAAESQRVALPDVRELLDKAHVALTQNPPFEGNHLRGWIQQVRFLSHKMADLRSAIPSGELSQAEKRTLLRDLYHSLSELDVERLIRSPREPAQSPT